MSSTSPAVIAMKPAAAANTTSFSVQTTKEWVLPPRPKPGRKADTDNAPTKRKAQNREAQRAFRERRAARVGELEQQIRDIEASHRLALEALEVDNGRLKLDNLKLREMADSLTKELNTIRSLAKLSESPTHSLRTPHLTQHHSYSSIHVQQMVSPAPSNELDGSAYYTSTPAISPLRFEGLSDAYLGQSVPLRRRKRTGGSETPVFKRQKSVERKVDTLSYEADYPFSSAAFKPPAGESCGFCSDGTPCLCAEAAQQQAMAEHHALHAAEDNQEICGTCTKVKPCLCVAERRPSDPAADISNKLVATLAPIAEEDNGLCTGNPGSCRQCQLDPMSTLFCRTLAKTSTPAESPASPERPLLTHRSSATFSTSSARDSTPPLAGSNQQYVPCSTAYQTLSRHQNFNESSMSTIVKGLEVDRTSGRGVEVGSVRDVLRILDRGLGRDM